jgi:hypothetical protein
MPKPTEPLTFRVDLEVHADLTKKARSHGLKKSDIARQYIFEGLQGSERLADYQRKLDEVSERLLIVTQELQKLREQGERTQRWIDAAAAIIMAYSEETSAEAAKDKWDNIKDKGTKERR